MLTTGFAMKKVLAWLAVAAVCASACAPKEPPSWQAGLRENGAFGFPQKKATVVCDNSDLRFSIWNNEEYLCAQAVVWKDGDSSLGRTQDSSVRQRWPLQNKDLASRSRQEIGDWSEVMLDLNADGGRTAQVDRDYMLNPWPDRSGLYYQVILGEGAWTGILPDSQGRGAIRYTEISAGKRVRVDTYLIPMEEISRTAGDKIRLCYWGYSPTPAFTVNSAGYRNTPRNYYGSDVPLSQYYDCVLAKGREIDADKVSEALGE